MRSTDFEIRTDQEGRVIIENALSCGADGALLVFEANEERWSFSRENNDGWVVEVREKQVISPWASTGTYWFAKGSDSVRLARACINHDRRASGEFYVAPLYNDLIAEGGKVRNYVISELFCFGTPEDMNETMSRMRSA